ncbi:unnamed protein product [Camellia sinensis]
MRLWLFTPASCSSHVLLRGLKSSISLLLYQRNTREEDMRRQGDLQTFHLMPWNFSTEPLILYLNPKVLLELFPVHCDWQQAKVQKISKKQGMLWLGI